MDIDKLRNTHGLVALISQRRHDGALTFSLFREFPRNGAVVPTAFIPESMGEEYMEMARMAIDRMRELRAAGSLPFPTKPA